MVSTEMPNPGVKLTKTPLKSVRYRQSLRAFLQITRCFIVALKKDKWNYFSIAWK